MRRLVSLLLLLGPPLAFAREVPDGGFGQYRFDIISFKEFSRVDHAPEVVDYEGELKSGRTYRATVRGDKLFGLALVPAPRIAIHHAQRVEWTNLEEFPALKRLRRATGERKIVFTVTSDDIQHMGGRRWNRTVKCKVVKVA